MSDEPLAIHLELRTSRPWPAGVVVIVNRGNGEIRVWRTGNQWGDGVLSFEVLSNGRTLRFVRRPQDYTRNVPSSLAVPACGSHRMAFDLGDGDWECDAPVDQPTGRGAQLVCSYDVPESPEAAKYSVWTGHLRSEPVQLE